MLCASFTISLLTPSNCIGILLLTPTKLNAGLSSILNSILIPPLTVIINESLGKVLLIPFFITSEGKKPHHFLKARVKPSID